MTDDGWTSGYECVQVARHQVPGAVRVLRRVEGWFQPPQVTQQPGPAMMAPSNGICIATHNGAVLTFDPATGEAATFATSDGEVQRVPAPADREDKR